MEDYMRGNVDLTGSEKGTFIGFSYHGDEHSF
jgi:hypothetical protein